MVIEGCATSYFSYNGERLESTKGLLMTDDFSDNELPVESLDDLDEPAEPVDQGDDDEQDTDGVVDIDDEMIKTYGNVPKAGAPFTMGDEVDKDEEDRHGI